MLGFRKPSKADNGVPLGAKVNGRAILSATHSEAVIPREATDNIRAASEVHRYLFRRDPGRREIISDAAQAYKQALKLTPSEYEDFKRARETLEHKEQAIG